MKRKILLIDLDNCVRCYACEVACRQEHDLSYETKARWCRVITIEPRRIKNELHMDFIPIFCFHCDEPICSYFCPVNAIHKEDDGRVVINEENCIGCRLCVQGCPFGSIFINEVTGKAGKCDLCISRVNYGIEPTCVQHCIGGALQFVDLEELSNITKGEHILRMGLIYYTSSKWRLKK